MIPLKCALSLDSYLTEKMITGLLFMVSPAFDRLQATADTRARAAARAVLACIGGDQGKQTAD